MWYMNEERELLQKAFREFAQTRIRPRVPAMEEQEADSEALLREAGELGFYGLAVPEEFGGSGVDFINEGLFFEEVGKESPTLGLQVGIQSMFIKQLLMPGSCTPEQIEKYVKPAMRGEVILATASTEGQGASWHDGFQTTAVKDGDEWIINGRKDLITEVGVADYYMVHCKTKDKVDLRSADPGITAFFVPAEKVKMGHIENKIGLKGSQTGSIYLDNVRVSDADRIPGMQIVTAGAEYLGFYGALCLGACETVISKTVEYLKNRVMAGVSMWDAHESTRSDIGHLQAKVHAFRNSVYGYLANLNEGDMMRATAESFSVKVVGIDLLLEVSMECIKLFGGAGVIYETGIERYLRDAVVYTHCCTSSKTFINALSMMIF